MLRRPQSKQRDDHLDVYILFLEQTCRLESDDGRDHLGQRRYAAERGKLVLAIGLFGNARQGLWRRIAEHDVMSRPVQTADPLGGRGTVCSDMPRRLTPEVLKLLPAKRVDRDPR